MAQFDSEQHSVNLLLKAGGNIIGSQEEATLTLTRNLIGISPKTAARWAGTLYGVSEWTMGQQGIWLEGSSELTGQSGTADFEVSSDGGSSYNSLQGVQSVDLSASMAVDPTGDLQSAGEQEYIPGERSVEVSVSGSYMDPASSSHTASSDLWDAIENSNTVEGRLKFGSSQQFDGTFLVGEAPLDASGGPATLNWSMTLDGALTDNSTSTGSGLSALLTAFLASPAANTVTALLETTDGSTSPSAVSGANQWTGSAYPTTIDVTVPWDAEVTTSIELQGTGTLTRQTQ